MTVHNRLEGRKALTGKQKVLDDSGVVTVEYALLILTVAAVSVLLYALLGGGWMESLFRDLVERALTEVI
ncbi:MAG: DUF4244 domain-containing protein [Saccharothrix sp.]|nr:DUF4244 domain-containing protein [Saccharothrix sp.]